MTRPCSGRCFVVVQPLPEHRGKLLLPDDQVAVGGGRPLSVLSHQRVLPHVVFPAKWLKAKVNQKLSYLLLRNDLYSFNVIGVALPGIADDEG